MSVRLGALEQLVLLTLLKLGEEGHAPAIQITLGWAGPQVCLGTICKTLHRLEAKGMVQGRRGAPRPEPGGRRKRQYRASPKGLEALRKALDTLRRLYGRTPEHEFVGASSARRVLSRFGHMSDNLTLMPSEGSPLPVRFQGAGTLAAVGSAWRHADPEFRKRYLIAKRKAKL